MKIKTIYIILAVLVLYILYIHLIQGVPAEPVEKVKEAKEYIAKKKQEKLIEKIKMYNPELVEDKARTRGYFIPI